MSERDEAMVERARRWATIDHSVYNLCSFARAEVERATAALRDEVVALRDENRRLVIDFADYRKVVEDERVERLKQPAPVDPRRVPGAVVRTAGGVEFIVLNSDEMRCQQLLGYAEGSRESLLASDTFIRWATREECARHGIPYVDRESKAAPYVPKVWHVVKSAAYPETVVTGFGDDGEMFTKRHAPGDRWVDVTFSAWQVKQFEFVRPATHAERIAAGIDPAPVVTPEERESLVKAYDDAKVRYTREDCGSEAEARALVAWQDSARALVARLDGGK